MANLPALTAAVLLAAFLPAAAGAGKMYYASVENRLAAASGMELTCRAVGGVRLARTVLPRRVAGGGQRRGLALEAERRDPSPPARALCSWAYEGNFVAGITLFDSSWPEARAGLCRDPARKCQVVFEDDRMYVEDPDGRQRRVLGDLPVKRCKKHWLFFSTECSYPPHRHQYVGRILHNVFEYFAS